MKRLMQTALIGRWAGTDSGFLTEGCEKKVMTAACTSHRLAMQFGNCEQICHGPVLRVLTQGREQLGRRIHCLNDSARSITLQVSSRHPKPSLET
jgi:hypothetical protein